MIPFREIAATPPGTLLYLFAFLLCFASITLFVLALSRKSDRKTVLFHAVRMFVSAAFLAVLLDGIYRLEYLPYERAYPAFVVFWQDIPWGIIAGIELLSAGISVVSAVRLLRAMRGYPSLLSVKQAMDSLPVGIFVSDPGGTVISSNLMMNEISRVMTGEPLSDGNAFLRTIEREGTNLNGQTLVRKEDRAFVFEKSTLMQNGKERLFITAEDQTEQYRAVRELEEKRVRQKDLRVRWKSD